VSIQRLQQCDIPAPLHQPHSVHFEYDEQRNEEEHADAEQAELVIGVRDISDGRAD
jgi:hypothetical protein